MHRLPLTLFRFLILALVAVWATALLGQCPPTVEAENRGPITPDGAAIAAQCPEACPNWVAGTYWSYGATLAGLDFIEVKCSNPAQTIAKIYSTIQPDSTASSCWNCVGGCGQNCPPGELCVPVPRSSGSDCRRFGCPAGYVIAERASVVGDGTEPYCVRDPNVSCPTPPQPPDITVMLDGPSTIRTGGECTWSASAVGGSPGVAKTYTWYVSNNPVGTGQYYSGGRPSGTLVGAGWRLRVTATDGVRYSSQEIVVSESSSAPMCVN